MPPLRLPSLLLSPILNWALSSKTVMDHGLTFVCEDPTWYSAWTPALDRDSVSPREVTETSGPIGLGSPCTSISWSLSLGHAVTQTLFRPLRLSSQKLRVVFQDFLGLSSRITRFCSELLSVAKVFAYSGETMEPSQKSSMSLPLVKLGISESRIVSREHNMLYTGSEKAFQGRAQPWDVGLISKYQEKMLNIYCEKFCSDKHNVPFISFCCLHFGITEQHKTVES